MKRDGTASFYVPAVRRQAWERDGGRMLRRATNDLADAFGAMGPETTPVLLSRVLKAQAEPKPEPGPGPEDDDPTDPDPVPPPVEPRPDAQVAARPKTRDKKPSGSRRSRKMGARA